MAKFEIEIVDRPDHHFYVKITPPKQKALIIGSEPPSHTYLDAITAYIVIFTERMKAMDAPKATKRNSVTIIIADKDHGKAGCEFKPSAKELLGIRSRLGDAAPQSLLLACDLITIILETSKLIREQTVIIDPDEVNELSSAVNTVKDVMTGVKRQH